MPVLLNYPLFHADDDNGAPLTGGLLYTYIAGSSTAKATYTTRAMSTANSIPVLLNSRGEAVIYGSGLYKLVLKTAAGVTIWTQDNVELGPGQGAYSFFVDPAEVDQGTAGSGGSLYDILTALGTGKKATIYFPHSGVANTTTYTVSTTFDASTYTNATFSFENGAILAVATGVTLALPSPANIIAQPNQQIFSGAGTVAFSSKGTTYPEWWGAKCDGTTDCSTALQAAIAIGGNVALQAGRYLVTSTLSVTKAVTISGPACPGSAIPSVDTGNYVATIDHNFDGNLFNIVGVNGDVGVSAGYGFRNLLLRQIAGTATTAKGRAINAVASSDTFLPSWIRIENVNIEEVTGKDAWTYGIYLDGLLSTTGIRDIWISNSRITSGALATGSIYVTRGANVSIVNTLMNGANAILTITGDVTWPTEYSSNIFIIGGGGATFTANYAQNTWVTGGAWTDMTTSGNSVACHLYPAYCTNAPTIGGVACLFVGYVSAAGSYSIIGTSDVEISAPGLILTTTSGALTIPRLTTGQKNGLTAVNGMIVYDSTLNKFQGYENGSWTSFI